MQLEKQFRYDEVYRALNQRRCWQYCQDCKTKWGAFDPPMQLDTPIFYYITKDRNILNSKEAVGRRFVCQACHDKRNQSINDNEANQI